MVLQQRPIGGANASNYTRLNVQSSDAGNYRVVVANSVGSVTSATAILTVNVPPSLTLQPAAQSVKAWSDATFTVTAFGTQPLAYQWRLNGSTIPGATASAYTRPDVQAIDAGNYSVTVINVAGSVTSQDALLTVIPIVAPQLTSIEADLTGILIRGNGDPGNYVIEISTNLIVWNFAATVPSSTGAFTWRDPALDSPKYYRARWTP